MKRTTIARLDQLVAQQMRAGGIPGVGLALTDRAGLVHVATYGAPVTPDTLFEIGSIGKSFTAILLLQEAERGRIDLHAPVTAYLPWFAVRSSHEPITLHHLLSHTAAITVGSDFSPDARAEVWALRDTETSAAPGAHFHYSNVGYKALGLVLQRVLGRPYGELVAERILHPLDMASTSPTITNSIRPRLAVGYHTFPDDQPASPSHSLAPAPWLETDTADGCIAATPADLAAYLRMLLNRGEGPHGRLLTETSFARLVERVVPAWEGRYYGYGLATWEAGGHTYLGHGGGMPGFTASLMGDLDAGLGAVALVNGPGDAHAIAAGALELLHAELAGADLPPLPPTPKPTRVPDAQVYAGTYTSGTKTLTLHAEDEQVILTHGATRIVLQQRGPDRFYVDHPDYARFLLRFGREGDAVVEAFHGPDWYRHERYAGPTHFEHPPEWAACPGHYRSHNPWVSNFRIVLRKGALVLVYPSGLEEPLVPLGESTFRVGADEWDPERIRFGPIVEGEALQATLSMCDYYRFFTP